MRISDWSSDVCSSDLRLPEKLLGLTNLRLKLLERGKWQAGEVFRFVDQRRRLVLERLDLLVDLLERAGRRQHILGVVGGIIDDPTEELGAGGRRYAGDGDHGARKSTRLNSSH